VTSVTLDQEIADIKGQGPDLINSLL
jgi:hypothetical protein